MRVLVVFEKKIVRELLSFFTEGKYLMDVAEAENAEQAVQTLAREANGFDLVLCDYHAGGNQLFEQVFSKGDTLHFLCSTDSPPTGEFFEKQKNWIHFLDPANLLVALNNTVKRLFNDSIKDTRPANQQFARIRAPLLLLSNPLPGDVFFKLADEKHLRLIRKGESFDQVDLTYFQTRHKLTHLYVRAADVINYTARLHGVISGKQKAGAAPSNPQTEADRVRVYDQAIEKPDPAQVNPAFEGPAAPLGTAKEYAEKRAAIEQAKAELLGRNKPAPANAPPPQDRQVQLEAIAQAVSQELTSALEGIVKATNDLGFSAKAQEMTWTNMLQVTELVRRSPRLSVVLNSLRREKDKYVSSHSLLLAHIACAIATHLEWTNEQTYQKLALAAFLHCLLYTSDAADE